MKKDTNQRGKQPRQTIAKWAAILTLATMIILVTLLILQPEKKLHFDHQSYNLLIITLDTMRADHIGAYGYPSAQTPHMDHLANNGFLFENCYSPVPLTLPAHCSLFTGNYPPGHGVRDNGSFFLDAQQTTLAELMKKNGSHTYAAIAAFVLLAKFGLNQGFDLYDDALDDDKVITELESEINAERVYSKFNQWLQKYIQSASSPSSSPSHPHRTPFFAWVHFYDPHSPYQPPDSFLQKFPSTLTGQYDAEVAYMDVYIGKIIEDLKKNRLLDHTLIIIVGDHGEAFGEHDELGHSFFCYQENIHIPLIFYNPILLSQPQRIRDSINLVDIMPTIIDLFQLKNDTTCQGTSFSHLFTGATGKTQRTHYIESMHGREEMGWAPLTAIIHENYKYISLPEPELYDLVNDKNEKNNLFWKENRLAKKMDQQLAQLILSYSTNNTDSRRQLSNNDQQQLKSLGYISAFSSKKETRLDPKQGIKIKNRYNKIEALIQGNTSNTSSSALTEAEKQLQDLVNENPHNLLPQYFGLLDLIYKKQNQPDRVITNWQNAIQAFPQNEFLKVNLAFEYFYNKQLDEAEALAQELVKANPTLTQALVLLARIREYHKNPQGALQYYEKAVASEPQNTSLRISYGKILGQLHQHDRAWQQCQTLLEDPAILHNPVVKARLGILLVEIGQDEKARELLTDVVQRDDSEPDAWNYLGILYYRQGNYEKALVAYNRAIELDPKIAKAFNNLGTLYLGRALEKRDSKLLDQAVSAFNKALELDPELTSALNGRASAHKYSNRLTQALDDWQRALSLKPDYIDVYFNLAITYLQINKKDLALFYLKKCKQDFYNQLPPRAQQRLDRLIFEAEHK